QLKLEEAGGGLRAPGESVHFSCHGSGFTFQNHYVRWYRKAPGRSLDWVFLFNSPLCSIQKCGAAVEGQATASRDSFQSQSSLYLRDLHPRDSAWYFCA
ncbi:HV01 protein, partial [Xiphorhynchus elegans]|nr:HV01 protein [Xiphorhynchus elegans]